MKSNLCWLVCGVLLLTGIWMPRVSAAEIKLGDFQLDVPEDWEQQEPKSRIIAYEFSAPAVEGDDADGRMTVMAAGGSVEDNIERWYGQFVQPDGSSTKQRSKVEKVEIAGQEVYLVDISGTFRDMPAPFAGGRAVDRPKYRMLAAIIRTDNAQIFVKFYGPRATVTENEKAFRAMIDSLQES